MKKINGLTLTELIVATLVMSIIMFGITAVDYALRQTHKGTTQSSLIAMQTSSIMLRMSKDAQMATGDRNNPGITRNGDSIWIREEDPANPNPDPGDYADDISVSYTMIPATYTLYRCTFPEGTWPPSACTAADEEIGKIAQFIYSSGTDDSLGVQSFYYEITLVNRPDPASPKNTFDNPEYSLTSRFSPSASSY